MSRADDDFVEALRIRAVLERYCSLLDSGAANELLSLFEDDCVFTMMGRTYEGKSEFAAVWQGITRIERPTTLHALVNPDIVITAEGATAISNWVLVNRAGEGNATQIALAGRYYDSLRRGDDGVWRFTCRRVETLARRAAAG